MRLRFALLASLALVASAPARAQDAPIPVTEADLTAPSWGARDGKLVELVNVKFRDYFDPYVRLVRLPTDKLHIDASAHGQLANNLAAFRTATGPLDRKGRSNIRVVGVAHDDSQQGHYIDVTDVQRMPDDVDLYKKKGESVAATDVDGRLRLADEAKRRADLYNEDDLREWARAAYEGALDARKATLAKGDVAAAIDLAKKYRDLAGASNKAIALLGALVLDASIDQGERDNATKVLEKDLHAVLHRDKWISREEFKAALGYLPRRDAAGGVAWVRRERVEFEAAVAKQREANKNDPNLRKLLGSEYEAAARNGTPVPGMFKQELVQTKGYGFPAQVDRFSEKSTGGNNDLVWDQWVMPDGSRFYFMNGIMFDWKKREVPWPSK